MSDDTAYVREFYRQDAEKHGLSSFTAVHDDVLREKETALIGKFFRLLGEKHGGKSLNILDAGCGNGYTLSELAAAFPQHRYFGIDAGEEMVALARQRKLSNCEFQTTHMGALPFDDGSFSAILSQRCLINLLQWPEKETALRDIHDKLETDGYFLMIEGFSDGLENNNRARAECGLSELAEPRHNRYFNKETFFGFMDGMFEVVAPEEFDPEGGGAGLESNFISSHYFMARVVHALVTRGEQIKNSEFVKFFSFLPPVGSYSPIQALILRKTGAASRPCP